DHLLDQPAAVDRVRLDRPDLGLGATRHLASLHAVLRAGLLAVPDTGGIKRAADHLVAEPRQVLDPAPADEHDRVFLEVVALARDVRAHLHAVRQAHARDLAQGGIRLLGRGRVHACAYPAPL